MKPMVAVSFLGVAIALAACDELVKQGSQPPAAERTPAASDATLPVDTEIMVGRVEVMQDQTQRGIDLLSGVPMSSESVHEASQDLDTYRRLCDAVRRYNALRNTVCKARIADGAFCGEPPYMPLWFAGRARPDTSLGGLNKMAEEMQNQMIPLWDAVCSKAVVKSGDDQFCVIE